MHVPLYYTNLCCNDNDDFGIIKNQYSMRLSSYSIWPLVSLASSLAACFNEDYVTGRGALGFNLGGTRNSDGQPKTYKDYVREIDILKQYNTSIIKTFSSSDGRILDQIALAIAQQPISLVVGVWPTDSYHFEQEKQALYDTLPHMSRDNVEAVCVGSEALYRGDLTPQQLAHKINEVKWHLQHIEDDQGRSYNQTPVGCAETWNVWNNSTNNIVIEACDVIFANAFSYWQGQNISTAAQSFFDDVTSTIWALERVDPDHSKKLIIGETGWPTAGNSFQLAVPSIENAHTFFHKGINSARACGLDVIVFEAFDENWKPATSGIEGVENNWGVFYDNGVPKYSIAEYTL